jgi:hypothetical protein
LYNYYYYQPAYRNVSSEYANPNDQRFFPALGLGLGFLGGLATGALLSPGPGFGRYPYYPYPYPYPYMPYPYSQYPYY